MESQEFLNEFVEEVNEHLQELESSLLVLEREGSNKEQIHQIFRAAHSIKGASAYMGFEQLANLTHEMESLFSEIQAQSRPVPPEGISLLLECVDFISNALKQIQQEGREPPLPSSILVKLQQVFSLSEETGTQQEELEESGTEAAREIEGVLPPEAVSESIAEEDFLSGIFDEEIKTDKESERILSESEEEPDSFPSDLEFTEIFDESSSESEFGEETDTLSLDSELDAFFDVLNEEKRVSEIEEGEEIESSTEAQQVEIARGEDEELLKIFLDSFQEHLSLLEQISSSTPQAPFSDADFNSIRETIERMVSSAHYMDYESVVEILEEWKKILLEEYENGTLNGERFSDLFTTYTTRFQQTLPGLRILPSASSLRKVTVTESPLEEEDEELLSIFLDSFQEYLSQLKQLIPPDPESFFSESDFERVRALLNRMVVSARYMDYDQFVEALQEWEAALLEQYGNGTLDAQHFVSIFNTCTEKLQNILPQLQIPLAVVTPEKMFETEGVIKEEDEELLNIFLNSFQENLSTIAELCPTSPETLLSDADFEHIHGLMVRMTASARYMDYDQFTEILERWNEALEEQYRRRTLNSQHFVDIFNVYTGELREVMPQLEVPSITLVAEEAPETVGVIEEEDEELLAIFLDTFQESLSKFKALCPATSEAILSDTDFENIYDLIDRMTTSCSYMDYHQLIEVLEEWKTKLTEHQQKGGISRQIFVELFNTSTQSLQRIFPKFQISPITPVSEEVPEKEEILEEEDEELLNIFLDSFRENLWKLSRLIPSAPQTSLSDNDLDQSCDLINRMITSCSYMDYPQLSDILENWEDALRKHQQTDKVNGQQFKSLFDHYTQSLQEILPRLEILSSAAPEAVSESKAGFFEEEDEELLSIFLDSFRENFSKLVEFIPSEPGNPLSERNVRQIQDLIRHLITSAQYMDYGHLLDILKKCEESFIQRYEGGILDGQGYSELLTETAQSLQNTLPGLQLPDIVPPESVESIDEQLEHVFDDIEMPTPSEEFPEEEFLFDFPEAPEEEGEEISPTLSAQPQEIVEPVKKERPEEPVPTPAEPPEAEKKEPSQKARKPVAEEVVSSATLRVDAKKVDQLLNQVGELVVTRSEFIQTAEFFRNMLRELFAQGKLSKQEMRELRALSFRLNESTVSLGRVANNLQDSVMRIRMLPISYLFQRFPRVVRDQALKLGKKIELVIRGGDTEMDKRVLEQMNDPIVQFLRNAIAHGIESPEERKRAKKPETGTIQLSARHEGNHVVLEIEDDGCGIDAQKLRRILHDRKVMASHEIDRLSDQEVMYSIFLPGISTRDQVDGTAGRGVGLDVVKENVERMNGTVEVESYVGEGTRFIIRIPLTVAIIQALLVWEASQVFTLPLTSVAEILRYSPEQTHTIEGFRVITLRGKTIPVFHLGQLLNMSARGSENRRRFIVIVSTSFREIGLVVDGLVGEREVVIKSIEDELYPFEGFSGATILGDGSISLILDVSALLRKMKDLWSKYPTDPERYLH